MPPPLALFCLFALLTQQAVSKVQHKVRCSDEQIEVEVKRTDDMNAIYLDGLKYYPDPACKPVLIGHQAIFRLPLEDIFKCGITRIINQATGLTTYYHRVVIETDDKDQPKESVPVKCFKTGNHTIVKRNVLPAGFQEPMDVTITSSYVTEAPQPKLSVGVRQAGKIVTGELNVNPGTPLQMEIFLDEKSAPIYGLLVSYMQVSDTKAQEETIIFNGCSVDPYLFENFNTVDGDFLAAKFRAFKFPDSTYVQFKGTVNVCLDKCRGVECSNGQIGYGRRKREVPSLPPDPNKVFEISITSFIKVDYKGENSIGKVKLDLGEERKTTEMNTSSNEVEPTRSGLKEKPEELLKLAGGELKEGFVYTVIEETNSSLSLVPSTLLLLTAFAMSLLR